MKFSNYMQIFPCESDPNMLVLHSTKNLSVIYIKKTDLHMLEQTPELLSHQHHLFDLGYVVSDAQAERDSVCSSIKDLNARNKQLKLTIVMNLDCNFKCSYCYENKIKQKKYLTEQTAGQILEFVKLHFKKTFDSLSVDFYGGEPLLSANRLKDIAWKLNRFAQQRQALFSFKIVTNGSLLSPSLIKELTEMGLVGIKVTLDGMAKTHDASRPFKSGAGSFEVIVDNLIRICGMTGIHIGGNYDQNNYKSFIPLLDHLIDRGLTPDNIAVVKFDPIMNIDKSRMLNGEFSGCLGTSDPWVAPVAVVLREQILKRGFNTVPLSPLFCMVENENGYVVDVDGFIYKCPAFLGRPEYRIGHVTSGIKPYHEKYALDVWQNCECKSCIYLPLCFGGCRYVSFLKNEKIGHVDCQKKFLDAVMKKFVNQDIMYNDVQP